MSPYRGLAHPVVILTVAALALRFYGIGQQGLWYDEAYTVALVKMPLGTMLGTVAKTESTPYLYYLLAWGWTHVVGSSAAGLRAPSALFGAATVPVVYLAAKKLLASPRAPLIAAALTTFNPLLIWYSQEARAYALLVLLSACTLLAFAYVRERPTPVRLALWAVTSVLALTSHYDAALVVVPEAIWILAQNYRSIRVWAAVVFIAACGAGLLPLLIAQNNTGRSAWIAGVPLSKRLAQILPQFFLGTGSHDYRPLMYVAFVLGLLGLGLLARRGTRAERVAAVGAALMALAGFALTMIVVWAGTDTLLTRNLLALWLPAMLFLAAGLGVRSVPWLGVGATIVLCAIGFTATVSVATDNTLQRPDWPAVARVLGPWPASGQSDGAVRLLLFQRNPWLKSLTAVYLSDAEKLDRTERVQPDVSEIVVVANSAPPGASDHWLCWWGAGCNLYPSRLQASYPIPGFHVVARVSAKQFTILKLVATSPRDVTLQELRQALTTTALPNDGLLIQR